MGWYGFKPYISVGQRRANAARELKKLEKTGHKAQPVQIEGREIARTFWGKAWCDNLESYSDFANRLPRGRTYVRNGSVCDLQIEPGFVTARVCGSELYTIKIAIKPVAPAAWNVIRRECAGQIASLIELLQGKLSQGVMQIITQRSGGLFPTPAEIELNCSCPDWADMCKHVAAALYGVGARLDRQPELLFVLRKLDHLELIAQPGDIRSLTKRRSAHKTIAAEALSDVFGIEMDAPVREAATAFERPARGTIEPTATAVVAPDKIAAPSRRGRKPEKMVPRSAERTGRLSTRLPSVGKRRRAAAPAR